MQVMPYDHIMRSLELTTVRALEDFIIQDCIYCRLLKCKLDQKGRRVHVQEVYSRDVQPAKLPELTAGLQQLCAAPPAPQKHAKRFLLDLSSFLSMCLFVTIWGLLTACNAAGCYLQTQVQLVFAG